MIYLIYIGKFYTLDAIWFFFQHSSIFYIKIIYNKYIILDIKYTEYLTECKNQNITHVSLVDKK